MKFIRMFIFILFNTLILVSFNFKLVNSAEILTIKANEASSLFWRFISKLYLLYARRYT